MKLNGRIKKLNDIVEDLRNPPLSKEELEAMARECYIQDRNAAIAAEFGRMGETLPEEHKANLLAYLNTEDAKDLPAEVGDYAHAFKALITEAECRRDPLLSERQPRDPLQIVSRALVDARVERYDQALGACRQRGDTAAYDQMLADWAERWESTCGPLRMYHGWRGNVWESRDSWLRDHGLPYWPDRLPYYNKGR